MMDDMVKRVAKALYLAEGGRLAGVVPPRCYDDARTAIEAMRDPGEDFASYLQLTHDLRPQDWSELIDAALKRL